MAKDTKETKSKTAAKTTSKETAGTKTANDSGKNVAIAVLATLLTVVLILLVLCLTGVIKFGGDDNRQNVPGTSDYPSGTTADPTGKPDSNPEPTAGTTAGGVTCYDKTRAQVVNLEFCLPDDFREGGKVNDGAYAYNLVDDDGWAEVRVYATKSQQSPTQFINNLSSNLKVTNKNYSVNGTTWVRAEASDNMLAFATKSGDYLYAVLYTIKLDSDDAREAWNMIPRTLTIAE